MSKKNSFCGTLIMVFLVLCFWVIPGTVEAVENEGIAEEIIGNGGIGWAPKMNYEQILVTVSRPDGTVIRKVFSSGHSPYLDLTVLFSGNSCNGIYTYELKAIPGKLERARNTDGVSSSTDPDRKRDVLPAVTQTGHFMVSNGAIVSKNIPENGAIAADVVHADDVIITGSQCIGYDCLTDGTESFGFDTIKLKENNLQIYFDDTSTTAGFPANDWRIITNDSSSGGASYFSIQDSTNSKVPFKILANAPTSSIFVDNTGRVGVGTSTPVMKFHVTSGDSPAMRYEQDGSYGWSAQTWDIAGNESNFFIRDVTGGSKLPFRIQPGTPTNTLTLRSGGYVGIGTWAPAYPLEINTTGVNASLVVKRTDGASNYINANDSYANFGSNSAHPLRLMVNSTWKMRLNDDGSVAMSNGASLTAGGVWTDASSRTLKENILSLSGMEAMDALAKLNPVKYNYKADKSEKHVGFIAEDVPELVATTDRKGMSPMDVVAVLTRVVQEQQKSITEQNELLMKQQQMLQEQQEMIRQLKEKVSQIGEK